MGLGFFQSTDRARNQERDIAQQQQQQQQQACYRSITIQR